jgi:cell division protein FtsB
MKTRKKSNSTGFFSRFVVVFLVLLLALLLIGIVKEYVNRNKLDQDITDLEQELENLKTKKQQFTRSIDAYQGEFFVEQEARTKFNMKKPGEKVVVIPTAESDLVEQHNSKDNNNEIKPISQSNILAWWEYFFAINKS